MPPAGNRFRFDIRKKHAAASSAMPIPIWTQRRGQLATMPAPNQAPHHGCPHQQHQGQDVHLHDGDEEERFQQCGQRMADVQCAGNLFVRHHVPEFEDAGGGGERTDAERVEEIGGHAEEEFEDSRDAGRAVFAAEPNPEQEDGERAESDEEPTARVEH